MHEFGIRIVSWISGIETGLVGEDDQGVGFDQVSDQRTQRVVVTHLDFIGGDGVVFVDDWDDLQCQQRAQG